MRRQKKPKKGKACAEGKTKIIYSVVGNPLKVIVKSKKKITKHDDPAQTREFAKKDVYATATTCAVFELLEKAGIPVAYEEQASSTEFLATKCDMLPLEVVARRYKVGSYTKRHPETIRKDGIQPERFHRLEVEFFLKTTGGCLVNKGGDILLKGLGPKKGEEDPLIKNPYDTTWQLVHPKKPAWEEGYDLGKNLNSSYIIPKPELMAEMESITRNVFLLLEGAWATLRCRLIDTKLEFGLTFDGRLVVADVIDNDSWRLRNSIWDELSKETFRQGEALTEVEKKYGIVAEMAQNLRIPKQALVLWRGSDKDSLPEVDPVIKKFVDVVIITCSGHKATKQFLEHEEHLLGRYVDGGVFVLKIGMSNGAGPITAAHTTWPVISIPASTKDFPEDVWSSLRMPSHVPMATILNDSNAIDFALNILARTNPLVYMYRQKKIEELDN